MKNSYPMKWHRFLTTAMIAAGILSLLYGAFLLTGIIAGRPTAVQSITILYGIALIVSGVFTMIVRNDLNDLKPGSPKLLMYSSIVYTAIAALYVIAAAIAGVFGAFEIVTLISVPASAALLVADKRYYEIRKSLFRHKK